jgi:hypothetical protein
VDATLILIFLSSSALITVLHELGTSGWQPQNTCVIMEDQEFVIEFYVPNMVVEEDDKSQQILD